MHDIVYILKKKIDSDELRYSLRSVVKNFPYRDIWFYGGCPTDICPDRYVPVEQVGNTTWEKVRNTLEFVCQNDEITEDFWLFNDDFFVIKRFPTGGIFETHAIINGTIDHQAKRIQMRNGGPSKHTEQIKKTASTLRSKGYDSLNYAVHTPMLINRKKGLETIRIFSNIPMFRSLYGNMWQIPAVLHRDVKLVDNSSKPDDGWIFLSTSDGSFRTGYVGEYIRNLFPEKCKYESARNLQGI